VRAGPEEPLETSRVTGPTATSEPGSRVGITGVDDDFGFGPADPSWRVGGMLAPGTHVGGCTIVGLLAEGGMGRVYEAHQAAPARVVAVKVMRDGLVSSDLARRFAHEADLLGRLRHPAIAQIHAAGTEPAADGERPFIVMELVVAGASITSFAATHRLDARERVALLAAACGGVAHAHGQGIIHRDVKPANILVDATGAPKLIDFGVGRSLQEQAERLTTANQQAELLGTIRYMSPEQVGLDAAEVDTRSDVYALGLVLHELLTGDLPYELRGRSVMEAASVLARSCGVAIDALAAKLRRAGLPAVAAAPLAAVISKCLEPEAAARYATAGDLEADLARWLAGEPVRARPPSLVESLRRLARRHRAAVIAAVTAVASLVAAVGGVSVFWLRAEQSRNAAEQARAETEIRRQEADVRTAEARHELYRSTVLLAAETRDRDNLGEARRLLAKATALAAERSESPIELDCLAASLDESLSTADGYGDTVSAVAWSPDAGTIAIGTRQGGLQVWHRNDRTATEGHHTDLPAHEGDIWDLAFSPDGQLLASASADGTVHVHDLATNGPVRSLKGHQAAVYGVDFSPDGGLMATASRDRSIRLWDTTTWQERFSLDGHEGTVHSVRFSPTGAELVSASRDGSVRVWNVADRRQTLLLEPGVGRIFRALFSPAGDTIAAGGEGGSAFVWRARDGDLVAHFRHPTRVNAVAFVGPGDQLATASGDGLLRCWDLASGTEIARRRGHSKAIWSLAATPDADVVTGSADQRVKIWRLGGDADPVLRLGDRGQALAIDPMGTRLAAGDLAGRVVIADVGTLREQASFTTGAGRANAAAFAPDGSMLAIACDHGLVHRWQSDTRELLPAFSVHTRRVYCLAFSADGATLATGSEDGTARLLDAATGVERAPPLRHGARVFGVAFHPDGRRLATACGDRTVRLWDVSSGRQLSGWTGHDAPVNWVAFSPAGDRLASASSDGTVRLWNVADGTTTAVLTGPARQVWRVAFAPDGSRVAACVADGTVQLWDVALGRPVSVLRGHEDAAWGLAFSPDGHRLVTTSWDATVRLWGISVAALARARGDAEETSSRAGRATSR